MVQSVQSGPAVPDAIGRPASAPPALPNKVPANPLKASDDSAAVSASWDDIKESPFEMRAEFVAGLRRLEDKLDGQIGELTANRAHLQNDAHDWAYAMIEMTAARSDLKSLAIDAGNANAGTWNASKGKIAKVWQGSQKAYRSAQRIIPSLDSGGSRPQ